VRNWGVIYAPSYTDQVDFLRQENTVLTCMLLLVHELVIWFEFNITDFITLFTRRLWVDSLVTGYLNTVVSELVVVVQFFIDFLYILYN
jgi:hypothetical protein